MRRATEKLAAEKADIRIPDYSTTLGELSKHLGAVERTLTFIAAKPAMELTPETMAQRIDRAVRQARESAEGEMRRAQVQLNNAVCELRGTTSTLRAAHQQRRHLIWAAGAACSPGACCGRSSLAPLHGRCRIVGSYPSEWLPISSARPAFGRAVCGLCRRAARRRIGRFLRQRLCGTTIRAKLQDAKRLRAAQRSGCTARSWSDTQRFDWLAPSPSYRRNGNKLFDAITWLQSGGKCALLASGGLSGVIVVRH